MNRHEYSGSNAAKLVDEQGVFERLVRRDGSVGQLFPCSHRPGASVCPVWIDCRRRVADCWSMPVAGCGQVSGGGQNGGMSSVGSGGGGGGGGWGGGSGSMLAASARPSGARIRELEQENAVLRRANAILQPGGCARRRTAMNSPAKIAWDGSMQQSRFQSPVTDGIQPVRYNSAAWCRRLVLGAARRSRMGSGWFPGTQRTFGTSKPLNGEA